MKAKATQGIKSPAGKERVSAAKERNSLTAGNWVLLEHTVQPSSHHTSAPSMFWCGILCEQSAVWEIITICSSFIVPAK